MNTDRIKELLKPIADGLLGKDRSYLQKKPNIEVRPVGMIVSDLCEIPEEDWYHYAFSREPLNGKLNDSLRKELMRKSIDCGREYAGKYAAEYGTRNPWKIGEELGLKIDRPDIPQSTERVLFAEFREPKTVHIFGDGLKKAAVVLTEPGIPAEITGTEQIGSILLSHEMFHYIEEVHKKEIWTRTYRIDLWNKGPLHNFSGLVMLGEIAAMAFAKELNEIRYSPYVLDALLVYGYSPMAASALYEEMMKYVGKEARHAEA